MNTVQSMWFHDIISCLIQWDISPGEWTAREIVPEKWNQWTDYIGDDGREGAGQSALYGMAIK